MSRTAKQAKPKEGRIALRIPGPLMARFYETYSREACGRRQYSRYTHSDHWREIIQKGINAMANT